MEGGNLPRAVSDDPFRFDARSIHGGMLIEKQEM
jgi:hypothetical protein